MTVFRPTRTSLRAVGGGGMSFLGAQAMTNSRHLSFFWRLPFEEVMWCWRYWPMGVRRLRKLVPGESVIPMDRERKGSLFDRSMILKHVGWLTQQGSPGWFLGPRWIFEA